MPISILNVTGPADLAAILAAATGARVADDNVVSWAPARPIDWTVPGLWDAGAPEVHTMHVTVTWRANPQLTLIEHSQMLDPHPDRPDTPVLGVNLLAIRGHLTDEEVYQIMVWEKRRLGFTHWMT